MYTKIKNIYKKNGKKSETSESKRINLLVDNTFIVSNGFFKVRQELRQSAESSARHRICCLTKNETKFETVSFVLYDADCSFSNIYETFFLYIISRIIQNISFNTSYDFTMRIKSLICKTMRFSKKIFMSRSYGALNDIFKISCIASRPSSVL